MSSASIKRHNHRVLPCDQERKVELINFLLEKNSDIDVAIISKEAINNFKNISSGKNVKIITDETLDADSQSKFDMMIHYDLPDNPQQYLKRISFAKTHSLILLDPSEQKDLYPIETALGRALVQDVIKAFETTHSKELKKAQAKKEKKAKRYEKELQKEKEQKEKKALKALPPKRNVRKIVPKVKEEDKK